MRHVTDIAEARLGDLFRAAGAASPLAMLAAGVVAAACNQTPPPPAADAAPTGAATTAQATGAEPAAPAERSAQRTPAPAREPTRFVLLTGSAGGNYYKAATELRDVAGDALDLDIRESPGSFHNIEQLGTGKADLAIAQLDTILVYMALSDERREMANQSLVVAPLDLELVHIVVRKGAHIESIQDLVGKRLSVGPEHSGSWISAWNLMNAIDGVDIAHAKGVVHLPYEQALAALASGALDAMFITTTPGVPILAEVDGATASAIALLSLPKKLTLSKDLSWSYTIRDIPARTYPFQKKKVRALATPSYLLARRGLSDAGVGSVAAVVYGRAAELRKKSELWRFVSRDRARKDIEAHIPYHDGVAKRLGI